MRTPEIGVENLSTTLAIKDLAFWVAACNLQIKRDAAPAWGREPWAVVFYEPNRVPDGAYPMALKDEVPPGEQGDHGNWNGLIAGSVLVDQASSVTLSHECLEMYGNPELDLYVDNVAGELCDPVQSQSYDIEVEIMGEVRVVPVSNFVLPSYFVRNSAGPWDYMKQLPGPFTIAPGGYQMTRNGNNFGMGASGATLRSFAHKMGYAESRIHRLWMRQFG